MQTSMFFAEAPRANPSRLRACDKGWLTLAATSCSLLAVSRLDIAPAGFAGKTSPVSFPAREDETLQAFWASSRASRSTFPRADGATAESSPASPTPTASPGECLTLNTSEHAAAAGLSPSDDAVCSLSDILETGDVPQRYYLTPKACAGILRRAERRGKELPPQLLRALQAVAGVSNEPEKAEDKTP